ncbi:MAG: hypothetical protein AAFV59_08260, partial [Pseudomonadota bacterium]
MARFLPLTVVLIVAIVPRLPFLGLGFGLDPDAYENITVAQQIGAGGGYAASRLPGYPVHEILLFLTQAYKAPIAANLLSLAAFVAATIGLHEILRRIEPSTALPFTAAFAAMPVGFAPSVEAMDYFLSLALVILSLLMVLRQRMHVSAAALGIATASRITNGAVFLAILPLIESYKKADAKRPLLIYVTIAGLFGLVFFSPVLLTYGTSFFTFYDDPTRPSVVTIVSAGLFGSWGLLGGVAAVGLSLLALKTLIKDRSILSTPLFQAGMILILLYWVAFFRLPHEVPYLLPAIIGFLMVLSLTVRRAGLVWGFAVAVAVSSFVMISAKGVTAGPILSYYDARASQAEVLDCFLERIYDLPENALVVTPTHPEWAYFRQGVGLNRPDMTIEKWHR